jgi:hypothetical protein
MNLSLLAFFLLFLCIPAKAQLPALKVGASLVSDVVEHRLGKITYPFFEAGCELKLTSHVSFQISAGYAKREYPARIEYPYGPTVPADQQYLWICHDAVLIPLVRYYTGLNSSGLFFHGGFPFAVTVERKYTIKYTGTLIDEMNYFSMTTMIGTGYKHAFSKRCSGEAVFNYSPSFNFLGDDRGTSGIIKGGLMFIYSLGNNER